MDLLQRYAVGTIVGEFEGRTIGGYWATCPACRHQTFHSTRSVADAHADAEIEVCGECGRVQRVQKL